ncbi:VOC family protein [Chitinophaga nivalis]|uniref:VOC family protein n=1 Tax=Chitinophaga nivalis TaxID=2991709 RepID=A0ABT3IPQ8_9BACT|nr:VOC family protein [Chitinophaga nivalis]MCW3464539.1 VOC family protein [Chitinophaga nivalis]MCW3485770.1 VOC family protein [Chitinophaga nivalis]
MQTITPFLWFDNNAEEAMNFYTSVFEDAQILNVIRSGDNGPGPKNTVMTATFLLNGQKFMVLNGGPVFSFTPAVSFFISCETQDEVDHLWTQLSAGGEEGRCGWLKDRFGLSWQVIPTALGALLQGGGERSGRVMAAMMQMTKIDIAALERAYEQ